MTESARGARIAIVTPSFARDFQMCRALNESILRFWPAPTRHYVIVDRRDIPMFKPLQNDRTVVAAVEEVIPRGYFKLEFTKRWWFSTPALRPALGWLVQQLVKLSAASFADEDVLVNVDSDVRFIRHVDPARFARDGMTRMYRLPNGVVAGMQHVKWNRHVSRLLDVTPDSIPMADYVGNVISWNRLLVLEACKRIEHVTGVPWHVAYTRERSVAEQLTYGLFVDKVLGREAARVWIDERSWCHTYWGPGPLAAADLPAFMKDLKDDDIAFSIEGYTATSPEVCDAAIAMAVRAAEATPSLGSAVV
jgi:hypothetical protein